MYVVKTLVDLGGQYVTRSVAWFGSEEEAYQFLAEDGLDGWVVEEN